MAGVLGTVTSKLGEVAHAVEDAAQGAEHAASAAVGGAGRAAASVFHGAVDGAKAAGAGVVRAARDEAQGLTEAGRDVADGVRHGDVLHGAANALGDVAKSQGHALADTWNGASGAVAAGYKGTVGGVREAGHGMSRAYDAGVDGAAHAVGDIAGKPVAEAMRGVAEGLAAPVREMANLQFGAAQGVAEGAGSMVQGLGDLVLGGVRMGTEAQYRDKLVAKASNTAVALAHLAGEAVQHPQQALGAARHAAAGIVRNLKQSEADAARRGEGAEWVGHAVGRAGFEVASFLLPGAKAGEAANLAGKAERATEALTGGGRAAGSVERAAHGAEEVRTAGGTADAAILHEARGTATPGPGAADIDFTPKPARDPVRRAEVQKKAEAQDAGTKQPGEHDGAGQGRDRRLRAADRMTAASGKLVGEAERQAAVKHLAQTLPAELLEKLQAKGLKVVVTDYSIADHATDLPRREFTGTMGVYRGDTKEIIIPTRALDPITGQGVRRLTHATHDVASEHADSTLLHEYGHAIDHLYGDGGELSAERAFTKAYNADKPAIDRFCQRPNEVPEAFTEMFAHFVRNPDRVRRDAPNMYAYFGELMGGNGPVTEAGVAARKASLYKVDTLAERAAGIVQKVQAHTAGTRRTFNDLEAAMNAAPFEKRYGSLDWVNPTGAPGNSLARAQAVDRMLLDGTRIPARGNAPTTLKGIRNALAQSGTRLGPPVDYNGVEQAMLAAGEGSRAIVQGRVAGDPAPRFWNVVVHDGAMRAVDGGAQREAAAKTLAGLDLPGIDTGSGGRWSGLPNFNDCTEIRLGTIRKPGEP